MSIRKVNDDYNLDSESDNAILAVRELMARENKQLQKKGIYKMQIISGNRSGYARKSQDLKNKEYWYNRRLKELQTKDEDIAIRSANLAERMKHEK